MRRRAAVEKDAQAQRDAAEAARQARIRSPARQLAELVTSRGWRVGRPQFTIGELAGRVGRHGRKIGDGVHCWVGSSCNDRKERPVMASTQRHAAHGWLPSHPHLTSLLLPAGDRRPAIDEEGLVAWPVLFFYPEASMQHDAVDHFCEEDTFKCVLANWVSCGRQGQWEASLRPGVGLQRCRSDTSSAA